MLKLNPPSITLSGLTLRGSIELLNPNQNLAVIFQIQASKEIEEHLQIEPRRGIIMQNEIKAIKARLKSQGTYQNRINGCEQNVDLEQVIGKINNKSLTINMTMKTEYNRKMFEKLNIQGWESAKNSFESFDVPIYVSKQVSQIYSEIKISANNSLNKNSYFRESYEHLQAGQTKLKSKFTTQQQNIKDEIKFGRSLSQNRIFSPKLPQQRSNASKKRISNRLERQLDFIFENSGRQKSANKKDRAGQDSFHKKQGLNQHEQRQEEIHLKQFRDQRFLQVIMLAALAGFFVALGSNFKHLFS